MDKDAEKLFKDAKEEPIQLYGIWHEEAKTDLWAKLQEEAEERKIKIKPEVDTDEPYSGYKGKSNTDVNELMMKGMSSKTKALAKKEITVTIGDIQVDATDTESLDEAKQALINRIDEEWDRKTAGVINRKGSQTDSALNNKILDF